jgi:hypothetical protein
LSSTPDVVPHPPHPVAGIVAERSRHGCTVVSIPQ